MVLALGHARRRRGSRRSARSPSPPTARAPSSGPSPPTPARSRRSRRRPATRRCWTPDFLAHFARRPRVVRRHARRDSPDDELDELHRDAADPWGVDSRWYERRKRDLLLAALPRPRFQPRARGRLLHRRAHRGPVRPRRPRPRRRPLRRPPLGAARRAARRPARRHACARSTSRATGPTGTFDLVVVSEVGYFLSPAALDRLVERVAGCLTARRRRRAVPLAAPRRGLGDGRRRGAPTVRGRDRSRRSRRRTPTATSSSACTPRPGRRTTDDGAADRAGARRRTRPRRGLPARPPARRDRVDRCATPGTHRPGLSCSVTVVLDCCTDGSADVVARFPDVDGRRGPARAASVRRAGSASRRPGARTRPTPRTPGWPAPTPTARCRPTGCTPSWSSPPAARGSSSARSGPTPGPGARPARPLVVAPPPARRPPLRLRRQPRLHARGVRRGRRLPRPHGRARTSTSSSGSRRSACAGRRRRGCRCSPRAASAAARRPASRRTCSRCALTAEGSEPAVAAREQRRLGAVAGAGLADRVGEVVAHRARREVQPRGDVGDGGRRPRRRPARRARAASAG